MKWRLILGLGAVPALLVVGGTVYESRLDDHTRIVRKTAAASQGPSLREALSDKRNLYKLIATGGGWFIYDVAFYGVNLFAGDILDAMNGDDDNVSSNASIRDLCEKQMIANGMGIPACILTILLLKSIGLKRLQVAGFLFIAGKKPLQRDTTCDVVAFCRSPAISHMVGFLLPLCNRFRRVYSYGCAFCPFKREKPRLAFCILLSSAFLSFLRAQHHDLRALR